MARKIEIDGESKPLAACTLEEVEALSAAGPPGTVTTGYGGAPQGVYARLAEDMRAANSRTVGDLGDDATHRWEAELGLSAGPGQAG